MHFIAYGISQQTHNFVTTLWQGRSIIQPIHNVDGILIPKRQNYSVAPMSPQHWIDSLTKVLCM